jgi:gliding motility-associated lipoprotein GldK
MKKILGYLLLAFVIYSCGSNERGELVGVKFGEKWQPEKPFGMVFIPGGSFTMGKEVEDAIGAYDAPARTATVRPFYMDDTEITNSEYKEFVFWVRDSITRTNLALYAEELSFGDNTVKKGSRAIGIQRYAFKVIDTSKTSPYYKYMMNNYGGLGDLNSPTEGKFLNWNISLEWETERFPDQYYAEVMDSMYIPIEDSFDALRLLDTKKIKYRYYWFDKNAAAKNNKARRKDFFKEEVLTVYPDTTVWVKDFSYSYNDPIHQDYFWHKAYNEYPVVGVNWHQAKAFCNWRTVKKNKFMLGRRKGAIGDKVPFFRLPSETEWEYAARGGLTYSKYPWGGPYIISDKGCFLANFKPVRGDYTADGALYTVEAYSYNANDYGLYNMAGNVSEWTETSYNPTSYYFSSTLNPDVKDEENKRKVIRGGSWKDVAYFLEVSTRDYEYGDSARSYIGFRTVQDYTGTKLTNN